MDGVAAGEVQRIPERPERRRIESRNLAQHLERALGRVAPEASGGHGRDPDHLARVRDHQHLLRLVDLEMVALARVAQVRQLRGVERRPQRRTDAAGAIEPLHLLEREHRVLEVGAELVAGLRRAVAERVQATAQDADRGLRGPVAQLGEAGVHARARRALGVAARVPAPSPGRRRRRDPVPEPRSGSGCRRRACAVPGRSASCPG